MVQGGTHPSVAFHLFNVITDNRANDVHDDVRGDVRDAHGDGVHVHGGDVRDDDHSHNQAHSLDILHILHILYIRENLHSRSKGSRIVSFDPFCVTP